MDLGFLKNILYLSEFMLLFNFNKSLFRDRIKY
jgi:hypothetical protein